MQELGYVTLGFDYSEYQVVTDREVLLNPVGYGKNNRPLLPDLVPAPLEARITYLYWDMNLQTTIA